MPIESLWIIGAGGHGKVVADTLAMAKRPFQLCDEDEERIGSNILGFEVARLPKRGDFTGKAFHVAIGQNEVRRSLQSSLQATGAVPTTVSHSRAAIAFSAEVGDGTFLAAHSVIGPSAHLGRGIIVNHGAVVDHDCRIDDFCHIAPNATLGGGVEIGSLCLIGAGATVLPGIHIGDGATIAAGATIVRDVPPGETVIFALNRKK